MPSKFLILGCTGEVGSRLTNLLLSQGFIVYGISGVRKCAIVHPNHSCTKLDLLKTKNLFHEIKFKPDILIHTAWVTNYKTYKDSELNFDWLRKSKDIISDFENIGGEYLVVTSTCFEYLWGGELPLSEHSQIGPSNNYGKAKFELLDWLDCSTRIPYLWTRTFFQYGLNENFGRLVPSLIDTLIDNKSFFVKSPNEIRDFIFINDVVNILNLLIQNREVGIFNLGTGTGVSLRKIATLIGLLLNRDELIIFDETNLSKSIVVSDTTKLVNKFKDYTWTRLESAILSTIEERSVKRLTILSE